MKIVVFGASRGVGREVVQQALEAGHVVTAFMRSPETLTITRPNLALIKGDAMDVAAVEQAIDGQEVVLSALGPTRPPVPRAMETAARNIVSGMKKHGVQRLISTTGAGVRQPEDQPKLVDHVISFLLNLLAREVVLDSAENVKVIQNSGLDWTVVRFPRLIDGERTRNYRVGFVGRDSGTQLSRADGADFILKELIDRQWIQKLPLVSY